MENINFRIIFSTMIRYKIYIRAKTRRIARNIRNSDLILLT